MDHEDDTNGEARGDGNAKERAQLEVRLRQQELLADLGMLALSPSSTQDVFDSAVDCISKGLDVEFAKVLRLTPERDAVRIVSGAGWIDELVGDGLVPIGLDSQAGYTLITEQPVIVDDLRTESRFDGPALLRNHGIVSGVSCLIGHVDAPWGVLGAHTADRRNFNEHDANFVANVATVIAQTVTSSRAEARATEQERRLELALGAANLQMVQLDLRDGTFILDERDVLPRGFRSNEPWDFVEQVHPDDRVAVTEAIREYLDGEQERFSATYRLGSSRWFETRGQVVTWDGDSPVRFVGIHRDVTERVRQQERERDLEAQLQQAQKMEAVGRLAGGVAHDFNNILTAITGYVELLIEEEESSEKMQDLDEIRLATRRAQELTQQLLAFSRRDTHRPQPVEFDSRVRGWSQSLSKVLGEGVELRLDLRASGRSITIDPGQLEQLVVHLATNAASAMDGEGRFTIRSRLKLDDPDGEPTCDRLVAEFVDNGCGIPQELHDKVLEPFFTTKNGDDGAGLGLALVYRVVERSGAEIDLDSEVGVGTTIRIRWPLSDAFREEREGDRKTQASVEDVRVLFIEDDRGLRRLGVRIMRQAGYDVVPAANPADAWEAAVEEGPFDLVVSDVVMPGESGPEFVARLRQREDDVRVLYVSGYNESDRLKEQRERDDVLFLPKPFEPNDLLAAMRRLLT